MSKELYKRGSFTVPTCGPGVTQEEWDRIFRPKESVKRVVVEKEPGVAPTCLDESTESL